MGDLSGAENAIDFLLILGNYHCGRIAEAWSRIMSSVDPWNGKAFFGGISGLLYLFAVIAFFAILLYDGFGRHSQRNAAFLCIIVVLFVLSYLK